MIDDMPDKAKKFPGRAAKSISVATGRFPDRAGLSETWFKVRHERGREVSEWIIARTKIGCDPSGISARRQDAGKRQRRFAAARRTDDCDETPLVEPLADLGDIAVAPFEQRAVFRAKVF